jgi:hypothetical protein
VGVNIDYHISFDDHYYSVGYRSALGLLRLSNRFGVTRLEKACERAIAIRSAAYRTVKTMLKQSMEGAPLPDQSPLQDPTTGLQERLERLAKLSVLICDDFGLGSLSDREKQDLLEALEERYGTGATVVTAQLPVADWHEYLGGGRVADAILDRLVHGAHRIELRSDESMRKEYSTLKHGGQSVE